MYKRIIFFVILAGMSGLCGPSSLGQSSAGCLWRAYYELRPGQRINLVQKDSTKIFGRLISVERDNLLLNISQRIKDSTYNISIKGSDITSIQYGKPGKMRAEYAILGMLAGGFIGYMLDSDEPDVESWWEGHRAHVNGMAIGGALGFFIGLAGSTMIPVEKTITCR